MGRPSRGGWNWGLTAPLLAAGALQRGTRQSLGGWGCAPGLNASLFKCRWRFCTKGGPTPQSSDALRRCPALGLGNRLRLFLCTFPGSFLQRLLDSVSHPQLSASFPGGEKREGVTLFKGEKPQAYTGTPSQAVIRACLSLWNRRKLAQATATDLSPCSSYDFNP